MAKQVLSVGSIKNDGTGDTLRDGAKKINDNFTELYNALGATGGQLSLVSRVTAGNGITVSSPSGAVIVTANVASTTQLGAIKVGENLSIDNDGVLSANAGAYTLPIATGGTLGGMKVGDTLQISPTGVVNVIDNLYTLPTATSQVLGGVKVGSRLTITNGVLSADVQTIPTATTSVKGGVIVDGITIGINGSGVISVVGSGNSIRNGDNILELSSSGEVTLNSRKIEKVVDGFLPTAGVVWTSTTLNVTSAKLLIQVEAGAVGGLGGWYTQVCEAIIANKLNNAVEPVMSVYAVTYNSNDVLATFTIRKNLTTNLLEVIGTPGAGNSDGSLQFKVHSVELITND